jgi:hypothetical protein
LVIAAGVVERAQESAPAAGKLDLVEEGVRPGRERRSFSRLGGADDDHETPDSLCGMYTLDRV